MAAAAVHAVDQDGRDVLPSLLEVDTSYYAMPRTGDFGFVHFPAPAERPNHERTIILHSRGYYRLHLDATGGPDLAALERLESEPGYAAELAADRYADWRGSGAE